MTTTTHLEQILHSKSQKEGGAIGRVFTKLKTQISQGSSTITTIAKRGHKRVRSGSSLKSAQSGDSVYKDKDDDWVLKWLSDSNL